MKIIVLILLSFSIYSSSIYDYSLPSNQGEIKLSDLKNKVILLVNIATQCGYTPQLESLQKIHTQYKDKGLVVIGIPSNDFGGQTPESDTEVAKQCKLNYGVNFPLSKKLVIKGKDKNTLYSYLINQTSKNEIEWNFIKFLISKDGKEITRFNSTITPDSPIITKKINSLLK